MRDSNNETGRNRRSSRFYETLDEILGHRPATQPEIVLDESAVDESESQHENSQSTFESQMESTIISDCEETQESPDVCPGCSVSECGSSGSSKSNKRNKQQ